jgi:two-component system, NarL family, nitrate/nitrite response regulator NarP
MKQCTQLTPREHEVLSLVAQRNSQIARNLCIAEHTVEAHLKNIFRKLQIASRTAASQHYCLAQDKMSKKS